MMPEEVWIAARYETTGTFDSERWMSFGVFPTEDEAVEYCMDDACFVVPILPGTVIDMSRCYHPGAH